MWMLVDASLPAMSRQVEALQSGQGDDSAARDLCRYCHFTTGSPPSLPAVHESVTERSPGSASGAAAGAEGVSATRTRTAATASAEVSAVPESDLPSLAWTHSSNRDPAVSPVPV